jgi:hypothetical protein
MNKRLLEIIGICGSAEKTQGANLMRIVTFLLTAASFLIVVIGTAFADNPSDILVIANNATPVSSLTIGETQEIFLKERTHWGSSDKAVPINAPEGSVLRNDFRHRALQMKVNEEQQYWQQLKIKSGVTPPPEFENVLKAVFKLRGSVSYIYRSQYKPGLVKILLVLPATNVR